MIMAILPLPSGENKVYRSVSGNFDAIILEWELDCLKEKVKCKR